MSGKQPKPKSNGNQTSAKPHATSLKELEKKRRQVFKPVLDNPFTQSNLWPFIEPELAKNIIDMLEIVLSRVGNYNLFLAKESDKSKLPSKPDIFNKITLGFNSTVSTLEEQAQSRFKRRKSKKAFLKYVFVAKYDISPSVLTSFFPTLAVTASNENRVKLIQLPKGTMSKLSKFVQKDNVGILGLTGEIEEASSLYRLIDDNVSDVDIPWLAELFDQQQVFMKPSMKHLLTSAPIAPKKNVQKKKETQEKQTKENRDNKTNVNS